MKLMGIICEYNPFHFGHKYQIETHKKETEADGVVCIMSGNFVQRGAPALFDKWTRAKMALENGADLVIELPAVYAAQSAKRFAFGAVSLAEALGCIDYLSFGSECGNLNLLCEAANTLFSEEFTALVSLEMKSGLNYPAARSKVLERNFKNIPHELLKTPNNILALEYINALKMLHTNITPVTLIRNQAYASASQIREVCKNGKDITKLLPHFSAFSTLKTYDEKAFDRLVFSAFLRQTPECLKEIADVAEGLEYRFLSQIYNCESADALAEKVKTKRYTRTRINRMMINTLLHITDADTELNPQYARILGFNDCGRQILRYMQKTASVPIITKAADVKPTSEAFSRMFHKDLLATDVYSLLTDDIRPGKDFRTSPVYVKTTGNEAVIAHYDLLIDENNDPVLDPEPLKEHMNQWDGETFFKMLALDSEKSVLEIGVGTGRLALKTAPVCKTFLGLDISPKTVARAKKHLKAFKNAAVQCVDFLSFYTKEQFDVIYATLTFQHIKDKEAAVKKVFRLLTNNGKFVLSIDKNQTTVLNFGTRTLPVYPDTPDSISALLQNAGFAVTEVTEVANAFLIAATKKQQET